MSGKTVPSLQLAQRSQPARSKLEGLTSEAVSKPKKLLDQVSEALRTKHYAYRTQQTFLLAGREFASSSHTFLRSAPRKTGLCTILIN